MPKKSEERKHGNQIQDTPKYEALRREGYSKEKAARISNAQAGTKRESAKSKGAKKGGKASGKKKS